MSIDIEKLIRLNKLISVHFRKKHIIVLDPKQKKQGRHRIYKSKKFSRYFYFLFYYRRR